MRKTATIRVLLAGLLAGLLFAPTISFAINSAQNSNPRNAAATPGDAEVIAGTGYQHTLFDSAEGKCQHCHNDLYDTWTQSGHSKAWNGPIFQTQFQGVVRGRVNQLDLSSPEGKKTFKGRVKFCVKCHAPAAWYSHDIKIDLEKLADEPSNLKTLKAANESNTAGPGFDSSVPTSLVWFDKAGAVYKASLHIGNKHNREGVNCAYCHSIETVRMLNADTNDLGSDGGQYTLAKTLPNSGFSAGDTLHYSTDGNDLEMNSFFRFAAAEIYADYGNTPKTADAFDIDKIFDGRHTIKSIVEGQHTGGPFYGPFGVTGTQNNNPEDTVDRAALVKQSFLADPESQHFEDQSKGLCLSCHQCAMGTKDKGTGHFNTGCVIWQANSGFDDATNHSSTKSSAKCTKCHMERVANKTVLHKWNQPNELFTAADGVSMHFDPDSGVGPVAEGYLNNHAFMATQIAEYGPVKLKSAVSTDLRVKRRGNNIIVNAGIFNKTGHFFPGTMPMRRALMRVIATDSEGNKLPVKYASGKSIYKDVKHHLATLPGETVPKGRRIVKRNAPLQPITFTGQQPDLNGRVYSQQFSTETTHFVSPHPGQFAEGKPTQQADGSWRYEGEARIRAIVDSETNDHFTRIYGYQQGADTEDGTFVIRPGMDTNKTVVTSLSPNEKEKYRIIFDARKAKGKVTIAYKVYYLTKGANATFPTGPDGFLSETAPAKLLISELHSKSVTVKGKKPHKEHGQQAAIQQ
ncbi:MAG: hypothetical protein V3W04_15210 [Gammaproteobacteria bacterium]